MFYHCKKSATALLV